MSYEKDLQKGQLWKQRITKANDHFDKWKKRFKCQKLEDYYEGRQWDQDPNQEAYVFNLIHSTIDLKMPSLVFKNPEFYITPKPGKADFNADEAFAKSLLATDTINTLIDQSCLEFQQNIEMALLDSFMYFGVVEVGYDATWIRNPNANRPIVLSDYDPDFTEATLEPEEIPETERIYIKRIPAHRFRVGSNDCFELSKANWVAYWEYVRISDIKAKGSGFKNVTNLVPDAQLVNDFIPDSGNDDPDQVGDLVKVWKLWDLREKSQLIISNEGTVIWEKKFKRLPLFGLRFSRRRKGWYPIPPIYNWKSPQDEMNETRQQLRTHRKRSKSIYQIPEGGMDEENKQKVVNGPDYTIVETLQPNVELRPVMNSNVDASVIQSLQWSRSDFDNIANVPSSWRGQTDRATATEITTVNTRGSIREVREQEQVATWLCAIVEEFMLQVVEKFTLPIWIKLNADSMSQWGGEYQGIQDTWKQIMADFFDGYNFSVNVQVASMSPIANEKESNNYIKFVTFMQQFPMVGLNPYLVRESAYRLGYRNEKVIKHFMEMAQIAMIGQLEGAKQSLIAQNGGMTGGSMQQKVSEQMAPPDQDQVNNQLIAQQGLGPE